MRTLLERLLSDIEYLQATFGLTFLEALWWALDWEYTTTPEPTEAQP